MERTDKLAVQRTQLVKIFFSALWLMFITPLKLDYQTTVPLWMSLLIICFSKGNKGNLNWIMLFMSSSIEKMAESIIRY